MTKKSQDAALRSMTGFAALTGTAQPFRWAWDIRSVNGKGLDLRLRVPDWIDGLEAALRPLVAKRAKRGNVTLSLRITRDDASVGLSLNADTMRIVVKNLLAIEAEAMEQGLSLAPSRATDIAVMRGVMDAGSAQDDPAPLRAALVAEVPALLDAFDDMRAREGAALQEVLLAQLSDVETLTEQAAQLAEARKDDVAATLKRNLGRVLDNTDGADPDRVAQELALLAVKADVTEEIDRLHTHVQAARALLSDGGTVGRKLDFLMQEFNREANTLCSKAQNAELTAVGLALKALIDQMREQVQNVE
ncbi:YicC/YloC family endoribonuclease [Tateyamaria omphalii]|uniref:YicC family protein n=1 Tax=Tateyamaria omphalii TaxID=299262 RepID=A0A1P8N091_9RHOB|nr:YicC/YloC family endoribonuclease [Tateyamaria omphalii]APX13745.1 YicC family protein [Tateyamaria omphalii]